MSNDKSNYDHVLDAAMQLIPYVGPSLSSLYFGHKQEKRFKRIETFYNQLREEVERLGEQFPNISNHDPDSLASIIESLHEKIESEHLELKRKFYKNYYLNILRRPVTTNNYDERMTFLNVLETLTSTQLALLAFINDQNGPLIDKSITMNGVSNALVQGSIAQLKTLGLLDARLHGIVIGHNSAVNDQIQISDFGRRFHDFCLS